MIGKRILVGLTYLDGELELANPEAIYTLRSMGKQVIGVEYLASWTIHPDPDTAAEADL